VTVELKTGRGDYRLTLAGPPKVSRSATEGFTLALTFDRVDGLERVGLLCTIARDLLEKVDVNDVDALLVRIAPWFEREFEQVREAALRSIRADGRPHVVRFDLENPGPFGE
jgi:hypothetical protein